MSIEIARDRAALRDALGDCRPGLVPTLGALHEGHQSLIARSARENELTVVSIFVNPTQFGDREDFARYPRDLERDVASAASAGADLIFAPRIEAIYPAGFDTTVIVGELAELWEGAARPGHFAGVATVVAILLNLVRPAHAYFGEKDFQQLQVIRRMHADLALEGSIVGCPTIRDLDGLALSSRNARLSPAQRVAAGAIPRAISAVQSAAARGEHEAGRLESIGRSLLDAAGVAIDYFAIVDGQSLAQLHQLQAGARLLVAIEIGGVRLIDNAAIEPASLLSNEDKRK